MRRRRLPWRRVARWLAGLLVGVPLALTLLFRVVPPPATPLMVIRVIQGHGLDKIGRAHV